MRALLALLLLASPAAAGLSAPDEAFLEELSRRSFRYFWDHADPQTGLVLDRARADGSGPDAEHRHVTSAATTGFGLSALCIGAERGWVTRPAALARALKTLRFLARKAPRERGWFYHWMDGRDGKRVWNSELSSIDTALLLAGVLTAKGCFKDKEVTRLADSIYGAVDFPWMLAGDAGLLSMGWYPDKGFIPSRWDTYSEGPLLYILGVAAKKGLPPAAWKSWKRDWMTYAGIRYLNPGTPLFTHQYPQAWADLRGRKDEDGTDYFENSVLATRAHKRFCLDNGYAEDLWGVTASDGPKGYVAWGGPPKHPDIDGTVVPAAAGGSLMFAPGITVPVLEAMKERFGARVWGPYGFVDAFHPATGWTGKDVLGIDVGITLLSTENLRSGAVWRWFMANPEVPAALDAMGVKKD
ncbi:MAG: hypothetical protein HY928_07905 [Elusimicrobia bacterium]|nr:hypothetical protein [Elusimicrobiota bacterium]